MDNYSKLNLTSEATDAEIEAEYLKLKAKYSEDRFLEGEDGRVGAVNLSELERTYTEIKAEREKLKKHDEFGGELGEIDALIKQGNLDEAQTGLDTIANRSGRWHFLQSIVYYKRNWYNDSRTQLKLAVSLEPENASYKQALERLEQVIAGANTDPKTMGEGGGPIPQQPPQGMDTSMGLANCCNTLCCMSCCCDMLRCC